MKRLTDSEIKRRLIRGRNLERLYAQARKRIEALETENRQLKQRIKELENQNHDLNNRMETLSFQFEQIKIKVFGKKPTLERESVREEKKDRDISSYRRSIPNQITETKTHPVNECAHCHGILKGKTTRVFFEEDIPLPIQKVVIKHEVEVGYCGVCRQQSSGIFIPSKKSILGDNIKKYICLLSVGNRLSHAQIQDHLRDVFSLDVSLGEIGNILTQEANNLRPEYEALKQSVLAQTGVHYDETSWPVQKEEQGKFAWVATGTDNHDTVFLLGHSRGKGNISDIGTANLGITDDYPAYKNTFAEHQLCWAHPKRKLRDLAESQEFGERKKKQILKTYAQFSKLYHHIRTKTGEEISPLPVAGFTTYQKTSWQNLFNRIVDIHALDPTPLAKIKVALQRNKEKYFTFLKHPGIPLDNNKAERALRPLVIKRKISFGSKTQRGAETTSILASIILSLKWNDPENWFPKYLKLGV